MSTPTPIRPQARIGIFAAMASPVMLAASQACATARARPLARNPKYFTAATLTDPFDAVIVDAALPNYEEILKGFEARGVPTLAVVEMPDGYLDEFVAAIVAGNPVPSRRSAKNTEASQTPEGKENDPGSSPPLSELDFSDLRNLAKELGVPVVGKRADIEAAILAKRAEAAATT